MKILGTVLCSISLAWLAALTAHQFAHLFSAVMPASAWLVRLSHLPVPMVLDLEGWAAFWPFGLGMAGVVAGIGLGEWAEHRDKRRRGRSEA
jgi:hypothetical protein